MSEVRNLDESVKESFDFIIKGHTYRFTHPTIKDIRDLDKSSSDKNSEEESTKKFFKFISKVDKNSPDWEVMFESLTVPHMKVFQKMIEEEFGVK